jgi:CRISPR-associated protein Cas2
LADREKALAFRDRLRTLIDNDDDQIRLYPLPADSWARRLVYGNRTLEERVDYWIV